MEEEGDFVREIGGGVDRVVIVVPNIVGSNLN